MTKPKPEEILNPVNRKRRPALRVLKMKLLTSDNTALNNPREATDFLLKKVKKLDITAYILWLKSRKQGDYSFNNFLTKRTVNKDSNTFIIADFSNLTIGNVKSQQLLDLKGASFIGSIFHKTNFIGCDLKNAKFCGVHLEKVFFKESNINYVDFRLADLSSCSFDNSYCRTPWNIMEGLKFSSTASCIRVYADIKNDIAKKNEQQRLLDNKRMQLEEVKKRTNFWALVGAILNLSDSAREYKRVRSEYKKMKRGEFHQDHIIHTSFQNVFRAESCVFDPVLLPDENYNNNKIRKKYFTLTQANLVEYLKKTKHKKALSLNDFAKELYINSIPKSTQYDDELKVIADLSSKVNMFGNNEWNRLDLSSMDFTNADLSGVNFAGSNLKNCNFTGANITNSNFESALMTDVVFADTKAIGSKFYNADLTRSHFEKSDFTRAIFDWSKCSNVGIFDVKMDFIQARHSVWKLVKLERVSLNCSDFTGADFRGGGFLKIQAKNTLFNDSLFNNVHFDSCFFEKSLFDRVTALHTIWDNSVANKIESRRSNFTNSKFSEGSRFEKSDFSYSILDEVKAPRGHFRGAILNHVKASYAKFADSYFEGASFKFADLNNCTFSQSNCKKADFTGAKLFNMDMINANLKESIITGGEVKGSDFTGADFEGSNWKDLHMSGSILENINNNRTCVNDNTEIIACVYRSLDGQFYYYDEDNFMDIMSIRQFESNSKRIAQASFLQKLGILSYIFRLFFRGYNIPNREVKRLHNYRLHNKNELKKHLKKLLSEESHGQDARLLRIKNLSQD